MGRYPDSFTAVVAKAEAGDAFGLFFVDLRGVRSGELALSRQGAPVADNRGAQVRVEWGLASDNVLIKGCGWRPIRVGKIFVKAETGRACGAPGGGIEGGIPNSCVVDMIAEGQWVPASRLLCRRSRNSGVSCRTSDSSATCSRGAQTFSDGHERRTGASSLRRSSLADSGVDADGKLCDPPGRGGQKRLQAGISPSRSGRGSLGPWPGSARGA